MFQTCPKRVRTSVASGTKSTRSRKVCQAYGTGTEFTGSTGGVKGDLKFIFRAHNLARVQNYKPCKVEASHSQKGNFKSVFECHSGLEWSAIEWSIVLFNSLARLRESHCHPRKPHKNLSYLNQGRKTPSKETPRKFVLPQPG